MRSAVFRSLFMSLTRELGESLGRQGYLRKRVLSFMHAFATRMPPGVGNSIVLTVYSMPYVSFSVRTPELL